MIIDAQNTFSINQALTGTSAVASTDNLDFGTFPRDVGRGEPLAIVLSVDVTAGGTTPTLTVTVQTDDNTGFSSAATVLVSPTYTAAQLVAGATFILPLPSSNERYLRLSYLQGGTSPTVTVSASLQPLSMVQNYASYPDAITIS